MTPKPPFLSASDYVFYIKKNSEQEVEPSIQKHNKMSTLLRKLVDDIVEGPIGFIEDFIEEPNEGISAILDYLKISLNRQQSPISMPYSMMSNELNKFQNPNYNQAQRNRDRQHLMKRAMADEYDCLQCLKFSISRNDITLNKILNHKSGLTSIGSCIVSNLVKSRIIALEILTKICNVQPEGYSKVLEAMTIMRILFGESVRFKLLVALVNSNNMNYVQKLNYRNESSTDTNSESDIQVNGVQFELVVLRFINALLANAQPAQRVRLQTEIEEAGFSINYLEQKLNQGVDENQENKIKYEINNYKKLYIDIVKLMLDCQQALHRESELKEDIDNLHYTLVKLEKEKIDLLHEKEELKERCNDLENKLNKFKNQCSNSNSSLESNLKKSLTNANNESNRSASDISNNHSANSDSGRWSTSDSEEGILISNSIALANGKSNNKTTKQQQDNKNDELIKKKQQEIIKKPSYFKLNLMNKKNKEISLTKFKQTKSKSDQNLEDYKDENLKENHNNTLSNKNEENVRNEDIFIYVPTIREKNNIKLNHNNEPNKLNTRTFEQQQSNNCINRFNSMNCDLGDWSISKNKPDLNKKDNLNKSQSNISSNSSTSSQKSNKPQILKVYPKRSNSIGELLNSDQSRNSDEDKEDEEIKKLFCLRKQITKSSSTLKSSEDHITKLNNNKTYKSNLQNSIDTLSTNNSTNLSEEETNIEDYEELIASTLQQKRIKDNNKTIWINNNDTHLSNNDKINNNNNLRGNKLYASFANGTQLINDKFKSDYNNPTLFRTGQYYNMNNINNMNSINNHKSTSNLSNSSSTYSNSALINGEFYLMNRMDSKSSTNSLNFNNLDNSEKFESLPPSIYGKHLNTLSKDKYRKTPQSEFEQSIHSLSNSQQQQQQNKKETTGKKIASQIQSYFFSGSLSNKKKNEIKNDEKSKTLNNKLSNVNKQINDLNEKFPLPNVYKKNFILKGHQNVGLYSNKLLNLPQDDLILNSLNTSDLHKENDKTFKSTEKLNNLNIHELKTKSSKSASKSFKTNRPKITKNEIQLKPDSMINLGKLSLTNNVDLGSNSMSDLNLLHREIALAAKEIGALY